MSQILGFMAKYKEHRICDVKSTTKRTLGKRSYLLAENVKYFNRY